MMTNFRPLPHLALLLVLAGALAAGPSAAATDYPTHGIEIQLANKAQLVALRAMDLDVTHLHGMRADALVTQEQLDRLQADGFRTTVLRRLAPPSSSPFRTTPEFLPEYTSYTESVTAMNNFASTYPSITQLTTIGTTHEGRAIQALKISDNPGVDENEPEVLVMGNHHAREAISVMIPLALADSLLSNYGSDPKYTQWVDGRETWIVPVVNPDGLNYSENTSYFWRKNRRDNPGTSEGVDLNRNYDYEWGHDSNGSSGSTSSETYRGPSAASEPETQAIQNFVNSHSFVMSLSYHSYSNLVLWGPGFKPALGEDDDVHVGFGQAATVNNGYLPGNPASGAIYITNGDADDWLHNGAGHSAVYAFTPEIGSQSDNFNPPANRIPALVIEGLEIAEAALTYADRPERLAPPGQPGLAPLPASGTGSYNVSWSAPTTADTQVAQYELTEKAGPVVATDDAEAGAADWNTGGWIQSAARAFSGSSSLYSGSGNSLNRICLAKESYVVQPGDFFSFQTWYSIETDWDYAYAVLSTDGGRSFVNLAGTGTTTSDPNGNNADNGITGSSSGWTAHAYDLSAWTGQAVWLGFRYYTDGGVINEGIYVDDVWPVQRWTTSTVLSSTVPGTSYAVTGKADGTYYYTVRGQDAEGDWGYPSATQSVDVSATTGVNVSGIGGFFLGKAQPNPFSRKTAIRYGLGRSGDHELAVYDVTGRLVKVLSSGNRPAGDRVIRWDGDDASGRAVPSGVYFYRLTTDAGQRIERAVVLR